MSEESKEKKWNRWGVVSDGTRLRCVRQTVGENPESQYAEVPAPEFSVGELAAVAHMAAAVPAVQPGALAKFVYDAKYRDAAFAACDRLNAEAK